ncbi:MAG: ABC transporter ATP-binding protein [Oscillospiraceae bacterium]|nr:MAG: ABC transporter ATP-binding protein [Oscillospiraceae bacterium]
MHFRTTGEDKLLFGKHINRYYIRYAPVLLLGIVALIFVDVVQLKVPELYRLLINGMNTGMVVKDGVTQPFDLDFLLDDICLPTLVIVCTMVFGRFLWRYCFFGTAIRLETDLRDRMFDRCRGLSQEYYQENKVGTLMSLFTNDLETVQDCFGDGVLMLFDAVFLGGLALWKMYCMNGFLTLLALIPMSLLLISGAILEKYMMKKWETRQEAFSALSDFSQESFSGIAVIKAFVNEARELLAFRKINRASERANVAYTKLSTALNVTVTFLVESVVCVILGYGGYLVYKGTFDAGQLVEFIGYFTATVWPIMAISQMIEMVSRGKASLERIGELLDAEPKVADRPDAAEIPITRGEIEFRHLTFRYPDGEFDVLHDVSFKIAAGERVGIVGDTGCGKTTLVDLLLRTYNVPDGTLFLDGHDINSLTLHAVRNAIGYVPQDNFLFSDTIGNNIGFSSDAPDDEAVADAAVMADVDDNIREFPNGYATVLGERGTTVSGGQKQRISIARALMKDAPILILDDAVSAVDTKTEKTILANLAARRAGRTTLMIAHRISTVADADKIIYMEDGAVSAIGTHAELYAASAGYRRNVDLQKLEDEGEEHAHA